MLSYVKCDLLQLVVSCIILLVPMWYPSDFGYQPMERNMPTAKLTKRVVTEAKPSERRYELWDSEIKGFGLRVSPGGRKVYILKYRTVDGTQRKPVIGTHGALTLEQARKQANEMLAVVRSGGDPSRNRMDARKAPTVADVCEKYLDEHAREHKKPKSVYDDELNIERHIKPALGHMKIGAVSFEDVSRLHRSMNATPYAANRVRSVLSKMFRLCEKWKYRPQNSNPCRDLDRYPERQVHRALTNDEIANLAEALHQAERGEEVENPETGKLESVAENPVAVAALRLLFFTGMRRNEALRLRWDEVDLKAGVLRLGDSKTGEKLVRLPSAAREVIEAQEIRRKFGNPYVFPSPVKPHKPLYDVKGVWGRIRKRAGLEDVRLHDLRHNFAAIAGAGGLTLLQIGQLLGHRNPSTTARYADLVDDPAKKLAEQVGEMLSAAMEKKVERT